MSDYNINIRNRMSGGKGGSLSKLSAGGSNTNMKESNKQALKHIDKFKSFTVDAMNVAQGSSNPLSSKVMSGLSKSTKIAGVVGVVLQTAVKTTNLFANYYEAKTGESMAMHNVRSFANTVGSFGINIFSGYLKNALFTQNQISRQNYETNYNRKVYNMNIEGQKFRSK